MNKYLQNEHITFTVNKSHKKRNMTRKCHKSTLTDRGSPQTTKFQVYTGFKTVQILLCVLPGSARENGTRFVGNETLLEGIYKFINNPPGNSENLIHDTCNRTDALF